MKIAPQNSLTVSTFSIYIVTFLLLNKRIINTTAINAYWGTCLHPRNDKTHVAQLLGKTAAGGFTDTASGNLGLSEVHPAAKKSTCRKDNLPGCKLKSESGLDARNLRFAIGPLLKQETDSHILKNVKTIY